MDDIIKVKHRGSFHVGGEKVKLENAPVEDFPYQGKFTFHSDPNGTHWAKQMYVQYTELAEPVCPYPILMWHGGGLTGGHDHNAMRDPAFHILHTHIRKILFEN